MRSRPLIRRLRSICLFFTGLAFACVCSAGGAGAAQTGHAKAVDRTDFTSACSHSQPCRRQAGPGPADRDVHPFEGSLGRPCAYRWRETPSGTRKVRVCY
ncbi:hypothetical protein [Methylobacterium sp. J-090]|uniref:hypothetical protein n=1 Tax=Methylobacterium sp. J-090 TaxID=2836666 RepID=UPI001FBA6E1F|nr:hypothetical protein [Methylobacterium sp. J-090]MCJ2084151.1 hypothetical protein [Methylobacterium sp. J-090]